MLGDFDSSHSAGGVSGPDDTSGCFWYIVWFCIAALLVIAYLKWS